MLHPVPNQVVVFTFGNTGYFEISDLILNINSMSCKCYVMNPLPFNATYQKPATHIAKER